MAVFSVAGPVLQRNDPAIREEAENHDIEPNLLRGIIVRKTAGHWPLPTFVEGGLSRIHEYRTGKDGTYGIAQLGPKARDYSGLSRMDAMKEGWAIHGAANWLSYERSRLIRQGVSDPTRAQIATRYNSGNARPAGVVSSYGRQVEHIIRRVEQGEFGNFAP
jgi:hypothetical protein